MVRATSERVGRGPCPVKGCAASVTFRRSAGGFLTYKCGACDSSGFAESGGQAYKAQMAAMTVESDPEPAPTPTPTPKPTPIKSDEPVPVKKSGFSLEDL